MKSRPMRTLVTSALLGLVAFTAHTLAAALPELGRNFTLAAPALDLVWIAPGEFLLGSPDNENSRGLDEGPQTHVTVTRGFWLGRTEVTQAQWRSVMGTNPSRFHGDTLPVEQASWNEAAEFCRRITERERAGGRLPAGYVYALPTEAQWEYAAKAGAGGAFTGKVDGLAWHDQNSGPTTHPVATKKPNALGLHDTLGNVWEWCADWYRADFYKKSGHDNPTGPASEEEARDENGIAQRVARGGSFLSGVDNGADYRPSARKKAAPDYAACDLGFRCARSKF